MKWNHLCMFCLSFWALNFSYASLYNRRIRFINCYRYCTSSTKVFSVQQWLLSKMFETHMWIVTVLLAPTPLWQYSRSDRHICFKLVIFQKFENLLKIRYILLYIWFDIMYMVFEYKINIRKLILWNFFKNTKENPQKWPKIQNNHLHQFFLILW